MDLAEAHSERTTRLVACIEGETGLGLVHVQSPRVVENEDMGPLCACTDRAKDHLLHHVRVLVDLLQLASVIVGEACLGERDAVGLEHERKVRQRADLELA